MDPSRPSPGPLLNWRVCAGCFAGTALAGRVPVPLRRGSSSHSRRKTDVIAAFPDLKMVFGLASVTR
jgi:hypothetical protein